MTQEQLKQKIKALLEQYDEENEISKTPIEVLLEIQETVDEVREDLSISIDCCYDVMDINSIT